MIVGFVELIKSDSAVGWAFDPENPHEVLSIEVSRQRTQIAVGSADEFREDLLNAGHGDGKHGFNIKIPTDLLSASLIDDVEIRAVSSSGASVVLPRYMPPGKNIVREASPPYFVFPGESADRSHWPVFLIGSARTGSSVMSQAILANTQYVGWEDGHLLDLVMPLLGVIATHYKLRAEAVSNFPNTLISEIPSQFLELGVKHIFVSLARKLYPSGLWFDKTMRPEMISAIPTLVEIWPNAKFIFMKRRPIENVVSRLKKFSHYSFEEHCRDWSNIMELWTSVKPRLAGKALEIDHLHLAQQPNNVAKYLGEFLRLSPPEVSALESTLRSSRPERTSDSFTPLTLEETKWSSEECNTFVNLCGSQMKIHGYSLDSSYFSAN